MDNRGGTVLKTGEIGKVTCLRQHLLAPGEVINTQITGKVFLEALRERETLNINAQLCTFLTPVRWLEPNWTAYLKEGPDSASSLSTFLTTTSLESFGLGGGDNATIHTFWRDALLRIYNEWYKWPEDADLTTWANKGRPAVPLEATWNRARYDVDPADSGDYTLASVNDFDVRDLAKVQARFRAAIERDVLSYNRYMELVNEMYGADGSREVDQVPMKIDQTQLGVDPREIPAQDAAGLGDWQSIYDFGVDHRISGITAPEHCVLTYMLLIRFKPVIEGRNPLCVDDLSWENMVGDPEILRNSPPEAVRLKDFIDGGATTQIGYLPSGWRWRHGFDVVGSPVDAANSFPMMQNPTSAANAKDATRIKDAFRSAALDDYLVDLSFYEPSKNLHGSALESYFSGMTGAASSDAHPKQGKML